MCPSRQIPNTLGSGWTTTSSSSTSRHGHDSQPITRGYHDRGKRNNPQIKSTTIHSHSVLYSPPPKESGNEKEDGKKDLQTFLGFFICTETKKEQVRKRVWRSGQSLVPLNVDTNKQKLQ